MKRIKTLFFLLFATLLVLTACSDNDEEVIFDKSPVEGKKIAYINKTNSSGIFQLCATRCQEVARALGMSCDVYFANNDDEKFKNKILSYAQNGYDGLYLSHGGKSYSYTFITQLLKQYPSLKIVTFDTMFEDEYGKQQTIEGVTQFFQDDADLAGKLLQYACEELRPEKRPINVLKVWVGPNYMAPFDRRDVGYRKFEKEGKIKTVEVIGPKDFSHIIPSMEDVMEKTLQKYSEKDIDVVWVAYDYYAQGCYRALKKSGMRIPLVTVDICSKDADFMKEKNSLWKACACTDFKANGEQGVRILALEMSNEYNFITVPRTNTPTNFIEMPASLITQNHVFNEQAPLSYGSKANFVTCNWLKQFLGY